jgi:hypothetical protein
MRAISACLGAGLLSALACGQAKAPTEVVLVVTSDMAVPAELASVEVAISGEGAETFSQVYELAGPAHVTLPIVLGLVSKSDQADEFRVAVSGRRVGSTRAVVERSAISSFVRGRVVRLDLPLLKRCEGASCALEDTCGDNGVCTAARVPPEALPPFDPRRYPQPPIAVDGGPGQLDAGADGRPDAPPPPDAPADIAPPLDGPPPDRASDPPVIPPPDTAPPMEVPPADYTIGGTVTGLQGIGLAVRLNLNAALTITANGPFTFPARYVDGTRYIITIAAQPVGPAQTCTIGNGSGMVAGGPVTNITVTCAPAPCPAVYDVSVKGDNDTAELSFPHQVGGVSPALVVGIAIRNDNGMPNTVPDTLFVTYGTVPLQRLARQTDNYYQSAELWWSPNVPPGTADVTVRLARFAQGYVVGATTVNNAAPQMPMTAAAAGINFTPSVEVPWALPNDVVLDVLSHNSAPIATPAAGQLVQWSLNAPPVKGHGSLRAGALRMSWTTSAASNWVLLALPVRTTNPMGCR